MPFKLAESDIEDNIKTLNNIINYINNIDKEDIKCNLYFEIPVFNSIKPTWMFEKLPKDKCILTKYQSKFFLQYSNKD